METLKDLRENKSLTQEQAAKILDVTKEYLSMLERGKRNPSDKMKERMCDLYNCKIEQIFSACRGTRLLRNKN